MKNRAFFLVLVLLGSYLQAFAAPPVMEVKRLSTGVVVPNRLVILSVKLMGRVESITRVEGEKIKKGELLLAIADREYVADLKSAEASLGLAEADYAYKAKKERRIEKLFREKSVSEDAIDRARLGEAVAGENVKKAKAAVERARAVLRESRIIAPFDAVVVNKSVEIGQMTTPGVPLFVLEDHSSLKFKTSVKEKDITHINVGDKVRVKIDAIGDIELAGKVAKIIPSGDTKTHSFAVEVLLPRHEKLYVGMFGKAEFEK